jgi:hypothetical protein
MDCNLDVVRGLACLFDPEGGAGSQRQTNGSPLETKPSITLERRLQSTSAPRIRNGQFILDNINIHVHL